MRDAITSLIGRYDAIGCYLDRNAIDSLKDYFDTGAARVQIASVITGNAAAIVREASLRLYEASPELLLPGGNSYTTRRYAACLRDMDYYLRYGSYALIAGSNDVLDERVLEGLKDTYNSLSVPLGPTVMSIQFMKEVIKEQALEAGIEDPSLVDSTFDYMCAQLSEQNI